MLKLASLVYTSASPGWPPSSNRLSVVPTAAEGADSSDGSPAHPEHMSPSLQGNMVRSNYYYTNFQVNIWIVLSV